MSSRPLVLVLGLSLLCSPLLTHASTCSELANTIHNDIKRHPDDVAKQNFPWKRLSWLKQKLGATASSAPASGLVQYHWECSDEEDSSITFLTDNSTKQTEIKGKYNLGPEGAGLFSACINCDKEQAPAVAVAATPTDRLIVELPPVSAAPGRPVAASEPKKTMSRADRADVAEKIYSEFAATTTAPTIPGASVATLPKEMLAGVIAVNSAHVVKRAHKLAHASASKARALPKKTVVNANQAAAMKNRHEIASAAVSKVVSTANQKS